MPAATAGRQSGGDSFESYLSTCELGLWSVGEVYLSYSIMISSG